MSHSSPVPPVRPFARGRALLPLVVALISPPAHTADLATALAAITAVGSEGQGNPEATRAWAEVVAAPADRLPQLLEAMNTANERACNYLFAAASAIAERETRAGRPLPIVELGGFLLNVGNGPRPRRLAFELLARADPRMAQALLPGLLDDPAQELRRQAVQNLADTAATVLSAGGKEAATVLYRQALSFARDADQIERMTGPLQELGHPVDLVALLGFLTHWKVIGPFDNTAGAGFNRVFPPEISLDLAAELDGRNGRVRWQDFVSEHPFGMIDLNKPFGMLKEVTGYATTVFESERARPAEIRLGCKNGWKVWFNGRLLFGRDEYHRGIEIDQYRLPVELKAGPNVILVKLTQNEQKEDWTVEWEFQMRVTDPTGRVLPSSKPGTSVALQSTP